MVKCTFSIKKFLIFQSFGIDLLGSKTPIEDEFLQISFCNHLCYKRLSSSKLYLQSSCEFSCLETNAFVTASGEIGICFWDIHEISGLSIKAHYYEKVASTLLELMADTNLPKSFLYPFNVFSLIANEKESDRITHATWVKFSFDKMVVSKILDKANLIKIS